MTRPAICFRATLLPALALAGSTSARAHSETQYWLVQSATTRLDSATSLTLDGSERYGQQTSSHDQYLYRVTAARTVAKGLEIGGGFVWSRVGTVDEYRPFGEATLSHGLFASRTRLEPRMFDNADRTVWRLRERLQLSLPLDHARRWSATVNGEGFFNLNHANVAKQTGLTAIRTLIGVKWTLSRSTALGLAYQRQQTFVSGGEDVIVHQPILSVAFKF